MDQLNLDEAQELDFTSWMQGDVVSKARNYIHAQEKKQASVSPPRNLAVDDVTSQARNYIHAQEKKQASVSPPRNLAVDDVTAVGVV